MPTYVYGCDSCGHQFEKYQKFQDVPLTECPSCHARIRRIFQPAGIVFKGSGWYSKDSRSGSQPAAANAENGSNGEAATSTADDKAGATPKDDGAKTPAKDVKESTTSGKAQAQAAE